MEERPQREEDIDDMIFTEEEWYPSEKMKGRRSVGLIFCIHHIFLFTACLFSGIIIPNVLNFRWRKMYGYCI